MRSSNMKWMCRAGFCRKQSTVPAGLERTLGQVKSSRNHEGFIAAVTFFVCLTMLQMAVWEQPVMTTTPFPVRQGRGRIVERKIGVLFSFVSCV